MKNYDNIYEYAADNYGLITSSVAKSLGIPNVELVKLAHRGRISRIGHGVYRLAHYIPTAFDKYAEAVAVVGSGAIIYGASVLAMHNLALVNPVAIQVAVQSKVRKTLPDYIKVVYPEKACGGVEYEGVPSQSVFEAILVCKGAVMSERLIEAVGEAKRQGLISEAEATTARTKLL
jgi:predicted transcriptional regulator of viral defense system